MNRRVDKRELEHSISMHKRWLLTGEEIPGTDRVFAEGGKCADFSNTDLCGLGISRYDNLEFANFRSADLRGANIFGNCNRANFAGADLRGANLHGAQLYGSDFTGAKIIGAHFYKADLRRANLKDTFLESVDFSGADLEGQDFSGLRLHDARLCDANLKGADLRGTFLINANLTGANLTGANLEGSSLVGATLVRTTIDNAIFTRCEVYGISVWDIMGEPKDQSNLIITPRTESTITVDNLEVAQFIYLLLNNERVRHIIDAVTSKVVLILGRFSEDRLAVLNGIREELRRRDFTPILFDFKKPTSKDVTGTVETLARMARFIIADITDPSSIPHELATIVPFLRTTPVQPLRLVGSGGYTMFDDLSRSYNWVLKVHWYSDGESLIATLPTVIASAEDMAKGFRSTQ